MKIPSAENLKLSKAAPSYNSAVGQNTVLNVSPAARNSAFSMTIVPVHSTSFPPVLFQYKMTWVVNGESDYGLPSDEICFPQSCRPSLSPLCQQAKVPSSLTEVVVHGPTSTGPCCGGSDSPAGSLHCHRRCSAVVHINMRVVVDWVSACEVSDLLVVRAGCTTTAPPSW